MSDKKDADRTGTERAAILLMTLGEQEAAQVLNIQAAAASKRYVRALRRLRSILQDMPGGMQEWQP